MLKSMTGYGRAVCEYENKKILIEIRSLNSKNTDINLRIPQQYKEKETEIRSTLSAKLVRGKIELTISIDNSQNAKAANINKAVAKFYFDQITETANILGITPNNSEILTSIIRMPDVLVVDAFESLEAGEWSAMESGINQAIDDMTAFRVQEGTALEKDILSRVESITELLSKTSLYENSRIEIIKNRMFQRLKDLDSDVNVDNNRFEQELIYYLEKLDITEEKVRLKNHCDFFLQTINEEENCGRKLNFISQEMGREINTLGSKANDADLQKLVIIMKDELEKIKEQVLNVV